MVKTAAVKMKNRNVKAIVAIIFPNFDCCSKLEIELATAKNTKGTTLTNSRFRKISPKGFMYSTNEGETIPMILPTEIPSNRSKIPE